MIKKRYNYLIVLTLTVSLILLCGAVLDPREGALLARSVNLVPFSPAASRTALAREPYVQRVQSDSLEIHWRTDGEIECQLVYGDPGDLTDPIRAQADGDSQWVRLDSLEADQDISYQVVDSNGAPISRVFQTHTAPALDFDGEIKLAVLGDSGEPYRMLWNVHAGKPQTEILEQIERANPDLVVHTGDLVYNHGEWENYDPLYFKPYGTLLARIPIYPCLGNHDIMTDHGAPYFANQFLPEVSERFPERYYSADYGNVHLISLDSSYLETLTNPEEKKEILSVEDAEAIRQEQIEWLREDLAATPKNQWIIVFFHHPLYSTARTPRTVQNRLDISHKDWLPLLEEAGVDLVLSGHERLYERFHPILHGKRDDANGIPYVVTGGGGGDVREFEVPASELTARRVPMTHHFVLLTLKGEQLLLDAIDRDGKVIDSWERTRARTGASQE
ncbi:MAG: metallophosphoesterase [Candidatus Omnitrophica bacterium]|nr:metallophosphoesterase [Candidatus Omnitrophota bacterium]